MQYWIIVNVHWIPTYELPSSCHKRPGLLTYTENDLKLKDGINFGIYWKNLLSHSRPWSWSVALALVLHVSGLGLGLDASGLVNIPAVKGTCRISKAVRWRVSAAEKAWPPNIERRWRVQTAGVRWQTADAAGRQWTIQLSWVEFRLAMWRRL